MNLSEGEIRVLGVLIEKSLTQPGGYPMTLNALTHGANQLQNRDPVVQYGEFEVSAALRNLQHKKLAAQAPPGPGSRSNRFEHKAAEVLGWDRRDQAIMAELMLRGRQTAGELRSRASRMAPFPDFEAVMVVLTGLQSRQPPFVEELPREPGRSANRFRHLLLADAGTNEITAPAGDGKLPKPEVPTAPMAGADPRLEDLAIRVAALESRVNHLSRALAEMRGDAAQRVDAGGERPLQ